MSTAANDGAPTAAGPPAAPPGAATAATAAPPVTTLEAWLTPSAGGYKIQVQEDVHGRTLIAGFVDDRVREQSGLQVDDVILSICGESVEGLAFARTTEMIRHHAREFETLVLKVSRKGAPAAPPLATGDDLADPEPFLGD